MRHLYWSALLVTGLAVSSASALPGVATQQAGAPQAQDRMAPGAPHQTEIEVGEPPPVNFVLRSIDHEVFDLRAAYRPLLLLFFRGVW